MYKLNHVQTTLRNKLDDEIHEKKVHPSGERLVHNNLARENESDENHKESKKQKQNIKKYFTVDSYNYSKIFQIEAEKVDSSLGCETMGVFVDKKK